MKKLKSKWIIAIICVLAACIAITVGIFEMYREKTVYPDFLNEYEISKDFSKKHEGLSGKEGYCYFFVQSEEHYCFNGNGIGTLKKYIPDYDISTLDLRKYNYIIAVNCKVKDIKYSRKTAYCRTTFGVDTYVSKANLEKTYDNTVRIYRMKSLNIDYPYLTYGPPGRNFEDNDL